MLFGIALPVDERQAWFSAAPMERRTGGQGEFLSHFEPIIYGVVVAQVMQTGTGNVPRICRIMKEETTHCQYPIALQRWSLFLETWPTTQGMKFKGWLLEQPPNIPCFLFITPPRYLQPSKSRRPVHSQAPSVNARKHWPTMKKAARMIGQVWSRHKVRAYCGDDKRIPSWS
jgi:hypothetical protein